MTTKELMAKMREHYDNRKIYYQNWNTYSVRIAFRKYNDKEKRKKETIRYYRHLTNGKFGLLKEFKVINLVNYKQAWYIDIELCEPGFFEEEVKKFRHPAEYLPQMNFIRNGEVVYDEY